MVRFIKAQENDNYFLAQVCRDAEYHFANILPGAFEKWAQSIERHGLPRNFNTFLIQELKNGYSIGFIGLVTICNRIAYITALYLLLNYQRQGHGQKTIKTLLRDLEASNYEKTILLTNNRAYWAINFYLKNDFKIMSRNNRLIKKYAELLEIPPGLKQEFARPSTILIGRRLS